MLISHKIAKMNETINSPILEQVVIGDVHFNTKSRWYDNNVILKFENQDALIDFLVASKYPYTNAITLTNGKNYRDNLKIEQNMTIEVETLSGECTVKFSVRAMTDYDWAVAKALSKGDFDMSLSDMPLESFDRTNIMSDKEVQYVLDNEITNDAPKTKEKLTANPYTTVGSIDTANPYLPKGDENNDES